MCVTHTDLWTFGGLLLNITLDSTRLNREYQSLQDNTGNRVCVCVCVRTMHSQGAEDCL